MAFPSIFDHVTRKDRSLKNYSEQFRVRSYQILAKFACRTKEILSGRLSKVLTRC